MTSPNTNIDDILDKIYSKLPPYMGHGGIVEEELNSYERHELKAALEALISAAKIGEVKKLLEGVTVPEGHIGVLSGSKIREYLNKRLEELETE